MTTREQQQYEHSGTEDELLWKIFGQGLCRSRTLRSQELGSHIWSGGPGSHSPHLGLRCFFAGEHEEDIASMKQRKGQVQKGDVLAQHAHRLKGEYPAPWWGGRRKKGRMLLLTERFSPEHPTVPWGSGQGRAVGRGCSSAPKLLFVHRMPALLPSPCYRS